MTLAEQCLIFPRPLNAMGLSLEISELLAQDPCSPGKKPCEVVITLGSCCKKTLLAEIEDKTSFFGGEVSAKVTIRAVPCSKTRLEKDKQHLGK